MKDDTTIIPFHQSESVEDPLTEIARDGARRMLAEALKAEADAFVASFAEETLPDGRRRVVRHGHGPQRSIQTGIGALDIRRPKVRDRASEAADEAKVRFTSNILPKWSRRSKSLDALLPVLYLRGVSTGDFQEALSALLGADAPNLSPGVISRLTAGSVIIGATPEGRKELLGFQVGTRESTQSWRERLVDIKHRGPGRGTGNRRGRWRARVLEGP